MNAIKQQTLYTVSISTKDFWTGDHFEYTVAADSIREARRIGIMAGEGNNDFKRNEIRLTDVQQNQNIWSLWSDNK